MKLNGFSRLLMAFGVSIFMVFAVMAQNSKSQTGSTTQNTGESSGSVGSPVTQLSGVIDNVNKDKDSAMMTRGEHQPVCRDQTE